MRALANILLLFVGLGAFTTTQAQSKKFKTTDSGLEYRIFTKSKGKQIDSSDIALVHMLAVTDGDSVMIDTYKLGKPLEVKVISQFQGSLEEGLMMLTKGDSAIFRVRSDSLFTKQFRMPMPDFIASGSRIAFTIKVEDTYTEAELIAKQEAEMEALKNAEQDKLNHYLDSLKKVANVQSTESGLHYVVLKEGAGPMAKEMDSVTFHYDGKLLNGNTFDASVGKTPMTRLLQDGQLIPGFIEGLKKMKVGTKLLLVIPSDLAYGPRGAGRLIGPYENITFEVELLKITAAK